MTREKRPKKRTAVELKGFVPAVEMSDPQRFWSVAASLGGFLANEGQERTSNPLVWVAALELAKEAVLGAGGEAFRKDWVKAQEGRKALAKRGVTFHIEQEGEVDGEG